MSRDVKADKLHLELLQEKYEDELTKWEQNFVEDVLDQLLVGNRDGLTEKQGDTLDKLVAKLVRRYDK